MPREKVDGVNLREEIMEVAFEQWTEPWYIRYHAVSSNVISTLQESSIVFSVLTECRE